MFFAVAMSLTVTGCWVYKPELADIPLIDHKGDRRLNFAIYNNPILVYSHRLGYYVYPVPGISASYSTGITERLAINTHADFQGSCYYAHAAAGLYKLCHSSVLEGYLGIGYGHGSVYIDAEPASSDVDFLCPFAQVNYGWHLNSHWDVGVSMKAGDWIPFKVRATEDPSHPGYAPLLEPQLFMRVGGEKVKFQLQAGYAHLFGMSYSGLFGYYPVSVSTGISIAF